MFYRDHYINEWTFFFPLNPPPERENSRSHFPLWKEIKGEEIRYTSIKLFFLFFTILFFNSNLSSQTSITTSQILATSKNEQAVLLETKKLEFLKNTDYRMPVSDELEYRTEVEEGNFQEQEHTLRWSFTGIK